MTKMVRAQDLEEDNPAEMNIGSSIVSEGNGKDNRQTEVSDPEHHLRQG